MRERSIAIGVLRKDSRIWIQQRPESVHLGGLWEFPGGKLEKGETPAQALQRELAEEIGLSFTPSDFRLVWVNHFAYPDRHLKLCFFLVSTGSENPARAGKWVEVDELRNHQFPPANDPLLDWLVSKLRNWGTLGRNAR